MKMKTYLDQNNTPYEERDGELHVGGDLYLGGTSVATFDPDRQVKGSVSMDVGTLKRILASASKPCTHNS